MKVSAFLTAVAVSFVATSAVGQSAGGEVEPGPEATILGHVNKFRQADPDPRSLTVPEDFQVELVARDLGNARMLAISDEGRVYVTRRTEGDVQLLTDRDGDGVYEGKQTVASRPNMHGIAIDGSTMYLVTIKELYQTDIGPDGGLGPLQLIVDDLPDAGQHPNRTLGVGPDGRIYISVGSTCNACAENNPENATIVRIRADGTGRQIFASGLRNTIGFDWNPRDGALWGLDHGIDWLGDEVQPEEVNHIVQNGTYGWPYVWGADGENPQDYPPGGLTMDDWKAISTPMVLGYTAHAAPMQMAFNRGTNFPAEMQGDIFAAYRGSWNREAPAGYEVVRIRFGEDGQAQSAEPFLTGFLQQIEGETAWTGRPTGLAFAPDGTMLVTDPENGALYRISYAGGNAAATPLRSAEVSPADRPQPLALERISAGAAADMQVKASFTEGDAIPRAHSAYGENISPALSWTEGPAGTQSYAIIVEDPDAGTPAPIVHWLAWNIPADVVRLPEGMGGGPQLTDPEGMRQGITARGSLGWFGPRPPAGDPPHNYHFQIFALDRQLDLLPRAGRDEVIAAMKGHVLGRGELIGTYAHGDAEP
jgi:Raf kinase inhibitor-like YbhB/YbcL family protein|tara:strand:- start:14560 stop:16335 length:1776 start_codon:yes stop_codon:yes gene_type:complete